MNFWDRYEAEDRVIDLGRFGEGFLLGDGTGREAVPLSLEAKRDAVGLAPKLDGHRAPNANAMPLPIRYQIGLLPTKKGLGRLPQPLILTSAEERT